MRQQSIQRYIASKVSPEKLSYRLLTISISQIWRF